MSSQQIVLLQDLGQRRYKEVWDFQEQLLQQNLEIKKASAETSEAPQTTHHLLFVEHAPVYTLGKSGHAENMLMSEEALAARGIDYFKINRGGDITFHGPGQLVGYPIIDLERFYTDIGRYLRNLEEVIIKTIGHWGIVGERSAGETGVWIEPGIKGRERKICAMGVRCSRWITMHGWALNINTDLAYFRNIVPCGIVGKEVTSMQQELGYPLPMEEVKLVLRQKFEEVFGVSIRES